MRSELGYGGGWGVEVGGVIRWGLRQCTPRVSLA